MTYPSHPYRVLLVIDRQWRDPSSRFITPDYAEPDFVAVASQLVNAAIPFDVLRLDQQRLDINYFLNASNVPQYGAILWMCDPLALADLNLNWKVLARAVKEFGMPLIVLGDRLAHPVIQELLGVQAEGTCLSLLQPPQQPMRLRNDHPFNAGLEYLNIPDPSDYDKQYWRIVRAHATTAQVLAVHDRFDAATIRMITPRQPVIWLGGDLSGMYSRYSRTCAPLLHRALTWCLGCTLIPPHERAVMLTMDDPGKISTMYAWHFPTLSREQWRQRLLQPLAAAKARMTINVIPGAYDHATGLIRPSFQQHLVDEFGELQDMRGLHQDLREGIDEGLLEIQCHGWTHLVPDLETPPGPLFDAPVDGERSHNGWYAEFEDRRRGKEVPAIVQRFRLQRGLEAIERDFGRRPLGFRVSGSKYSRSPENYTLQVAAELGLGVLFINNPPYIPLDGKLIQSSSGGPFVYTCHDLDLHQNPEYVPQLLAKMQSRCNRQPRWISVEEYSAYVHARVQQNAEGLLVSLDPDLCRFFGQHASQWTLQVADWKRADLGSQAMVKINGNAVGKLTGTSLSLTLPAGTSTHQIALEGSS